MFLRTPRRHRNPLDTFSGGQVWTGLLISLGFLLSSCGDGKDLTEPANYNGNLSEDYAGSDWGYVGRIEQTDAFIALLAAEGEIVAYACNGEEEIAEWFSGLLGADGAVDITNGAGARLTGQLGNGEFSGSILLLDGVNHSFSAEQALPGAGIYRVLGDEAAAEQIEAGWIIDNEGEQRGSLRVRGVNRQAVSISGGNLKVATREFRVSFFVAKAPGGPGPIPVPYPIDQRPPIWVTTFPPKVAG